MAGAFAGADIDIGETTLAGCGSTSIAHCSHRCVSPLPQAYRRRKFCVADFIAELRSNRDQCAEVQRVRRRIIRRRPRSRFCNRLSRLDEDAAQDVARSRLTELCQIGVQFPESAGTDPRPHGAELSTWALARMSRPSRRPISGTSTTS